jgi:hypothetical protein
MADVHIFGDEAGDDKHKTTCSAYYMIGTVSMTDSTLPQELWELRRDLTEQGVFRGTYFHACEDPWPVRNAALALIARHEFTFDATILEKAKTAPHLVKDKERFYKQAWFFHLTNFGPQRVKAGQSLFLVAASLKTDRKDMTRIKTALTDVCNQTLPGCTHTTACWPSANDAWLQVADYCSWAVCRDYESGKKDCRKLIEPKIGGLYHPFHYGTKRY